MNDKEIEREFRLACVRACEKRGQPRPAITVEADLETRDEVFTLGQKMLDEMGKQGIVWMYEEAIEDAAHAIYERAHKDLAWEGKAWAWVNGLVDFETADRVDASDLLQSIEDGDAVWMTITKIPKMEDAP